MAELLEERYGPPRHPWSSLWECVLGKCWAVLGYQRTVFSLEGLAHGAPGPFRRLTFVQTEGEHRDGAQCANCCAQLPVRQQHRLDAALRHADAKLFLHVAMARKNSSMAHHQNGTLMAPDSIVVNTLISPLSETWVGVAPTLLLGKGGDTGSPPELQPPTPTLATITHVYN